MVQSYGVKESEKNDGWVYRPQMVKHGQIERTTAEWCVDEEKAIKEDVSMNTTCVSYPFSMCRLKNVCDIHLLL